MSGRLQQYITPSLNYSITVLFCIQKTIENIDWQAWWYSQFDKKNVRKKKKNSERKIDDLIVVYPSHLFTHTHTHTGRSRIRCSEFSCMRIPLFLAKKQEKNTSIFTPSLCALTQCLFIKRQHVCSCVVCVCVLCRMPMGGKTAHTTSTKYQKKNPKQKHEDENSIFLRFFFLVSRAFEGKQTCCWPRFNQN